MRLKIYEISEFWWKVIGGFIGGLSRWKYHKYYVKIVTSKGFRKKEKKGTELLKRAVYEAVHSSKPTFA